MFKYSPLVVVSCVDLQGCLTFSLTEGHCASFSAATSCTFKCLLWDFPLDLISRWRTCEKDGWTNGRSSSSSNTQGNISKYGNEHQPQRPTVPLSKTSHTLTARQCTLSPSPLPMNYSYSPNITAALSMRVWKMRLSFQKIKPAQVITRLSLLL